MTIARNLSKLAEGTDSSGVLGVDNGGTGTVSPGASGNLLTSNGETWVSAAPTPQVYPDAGLAVSTGASWDDSLVGLEPGQIVSWDGTKWVVAVPESGFSYAAFLKYSF